MSGIPKAIGIRPRTLRRSFIVKLLLCLCVGVGTAQAPVMATSLLHKEAPEFVRTDLNHRKLDLRAYRGKFVLVNFWATWCGPCRLEMPDLNDFYSRIKSQGLVVLSITGEESSKVSSFVNESGYRAPVLLDPDSQAAKRFHVENLPRSFVFNRKSKLVASAVDQRSHAANSSRCSPRPAYIPDPVHMQVSRGSPYAFQRLGLNDLKMLAEAREATNWPLFVHIDDWRVQSCRILIRQPNAGTGPTVTRTWVCLLPA